MSLCKDITALLISVSTVIQNWVGVERAFTRSNAVEIYIKLLPVKDLDTATFESCPLVCWLGFIQQRIYVAESGNGPKDKPKFPHLVAA